MATTNCKGFLNKKRFEICAANIERNGYVPTRPSLGLNY
jgi:hypothetical protein